MRKTVKYSKEDFIEFNEPTMFSNEELRDVLMQIWINRNCITKDDIKLLQELSSKGLFKEIHWTYSILEK